MTGARVQRVRRYLEDDDLFCVTYGDGLADIDIDALVAFHRSHGRLGTVTGVYPPSRFGQLVQRRAARGRVLGEARARGHPHQRRLLRLLARLPRPAARPRRPDPGARAARAAGPRRRADGLRARRLLAVRRHRARRRRAAGAVDGRRARRGCPVPSRSGRRRECWRTASASARGSGTRRSPRPHLRDLGGVVIEADDQRSICSAYNAILDAVARRARHRGTRAPARGRHHRERGVHRRDPHRARRPRRRRRRSHRRAPARQPALVAGRGTRARARLDRAGRLRRRPARRRRARRPLPRAVAVGHPAPALRRVGVRRLPRLRLRHLPPGPRRRQPRARHGPADHAPHARRLRRRGRLRPRQRRLRRQVARPAVRTPGRPRARSRDLRSLRRRRARPCPPPAASRWPPAAAAAAG